MSNRTEARSAKTARMHATGRLPLLRLFSTPLKTTQSRRSHWRRPSRATPPAKLRDMLFDFAKCCQAPVLTVFRVSQRIGEENKGNNILDKSTALAYSFFHGQQTQATKDFARSNCLLLESEQRSGLYGAVA